MPAGNEVLTSLTLLRDLASPENRDAAWRTFHERYWPLIAGWCFRSGLRYHDAEEVSAAVLAKMFRVLRTSFEYDRAGGFRKYLRAAVANEARTLWRQRARRPGDRASGHPEADRRLAALCTPDPVDELVEELDQTLAQDMRRARRVMARVRRRVAPRTWQAYWRTAMRREPAAGVAQSLGMTVGAVYEAKNRVGEMLRAEGRAEGPAAEGG
jgi:RNA polymerase sigma-70 factor (ECF subfamily)